MNATRMFSMRVFCFLYHQQIKTLKQFSVEFIHFDSFSVHADFINFYSAHSLHNFNPEIKNHFFQKTNYYEKVFSALENHLHFFDR